MGANILYPLVRRLQPNPLTAPNRDHLRRLPNSEVSLKVRYLANSGPSLTAVQERYTQAMAYVRVGPQSSLGKPGVF